jgi:hypothetical protein
MIGFLRVFDNERILLDMHKPHLLYWTKSDLFNKTNRFVRDEAVERLLKISDRYNYRLVLVPSLGLESSYNNPKTLDIGQWISYLKSNLEITMHQNTVFAFPLAIPSPRRIYLYFDQGNVSNYEDKIEFLYSKLKNDPHAKISLWVLHQVTKSIGL